MEFGKSATNFDSSHAEACPNGSRNAESPKLPALFPNCMHCRLTSPEKGVDGVHWRETGGESPQRRIILVLRVENISLRTSATRLLSMILTNAVAMVFRCSFFHGFIVLC